MYTTAGPGTARIARAASGEHGQRLRLDDHAFSSQTRRRPSRVRFGSTAAIVRECGATSSERPPVATTCASTPSSPDRFDDAVHLAGEPVDDARLEPSDRGLADHRRRLDVVDLDEPRRTGEERFHRRLDAGSEHATDVLTLGRDDVEVRRGAEVDHDHRSAVAVLRGDGVDDPVGTDLARVVVANRDARLDARPDHEDRCLGPPGGEALPLADEGRDGRPEADAVDPIEVEHAREQHPELVARPAALGREAPVLLELRVAVEPEDGLRVADVDREEHVISCRRRGWARPA